MLFEVSSNKRLLLLFFLILFPQFIISQEFDKEIFAERRQKVMDKMGEGIAILESGKTYVRNGDVEYKFRQRSDFYYLTGFEEPASTLLLLPKNKKKFILFVKPDNFYSKLFGDKRIGIEGAIQILGADTAYPTSAFDSIVTSELKNNNKIFYNYTDLELKEKIKKAYSHSGNKADIQFQKLSKVINELRLVKDENEINSIKKACEITSEAIKEILKTCEPGMYEYELEAILDYTYRKNNAESAFPSIVGSGNNSLILHYDDNNKKININDILVLDVGAEYENYAADITRSFPANGKFSDKQKDIYKIVLEAQKTGIANAKKGIGLSELEDKVKNDIAKGLLKLGLISDVKSSWQVDLWMPHSVSHMLGLDVHDVNIMGTLLEKGNIFTIEPGLYINPVMLDNISEFQKLDSNELKAFKEFVKPAVEKYKGIGIRIEDDILITEDGCQVLSSSAPKEIEEIEKLMSLKSKFN